MNYVYIYTISIIYTIYNLYIYKIKNRKPFDIIRYDIMWYNMVNFNIIIYNPE